MLISGKLHSSSGSRHGPHAAPHGSLDAPFSVASPQTRQYCASKLRDRLTGESVRSISTGVLWAAAQPAAARAAPTAAPAPLGDPPTPNAALEWLVSRCGAAPDPLKVRRCHLGEERGWGVVATEDIEAGEVLLSVPLPWAITSEGAGELPWSVHMALQLLRHVELGEASPLRPWVQSLPRHVPLPWLYYSQEEVEGIQDEDALLEYQHLRQIYEEACQQVTAYPQDQLAWALSLVHSRSFLQGGEHVLVPGVDFCNHSSAPTATVRCVHSPESCQGAAAVEDVCPPPPPEPSRFELVAGEEGIRAGDEVTISYGSWPNDVFLFFFGFVPHEPNEADSVVLFSGLQELLLSYHLLSRQYCAGGSQLSSAAGTSGTADAAGMDSWDRTQILVLAQQLQRALGPGNDYSRLVVTAAGFDSRLLQAAGAMAHLHSLTFGGGGSSSSSNASGGGGSGAAEVDSQGRGQGRGQGQLPLQEFFRLRCQELLDAYPTSWEEDAAWLGARVPGASESMRTAVRFRMAKKAVLLEAVEQLGGS